MISMQLSQAARELDTNLSGHDAHFDGVSTDTRREMRGALFFALRGPNFDAHKLVDEAARQGAAGLVVEQAVETSLPVLPVADTRKALGRLARAWRRRFHLPLIAVTGSAGKTTVKEMIAAILRRRCPTLATRGNLNNDIGVPLTLFELDNVHEAAVIEMGANKAGDIAELCEIAEPSVGLVTLVAPAHLEGFGSVDAVARTKGEIIRTLGPDGVAVINRDDPYASLWFEYAGGRRVVTFGEDGDVRARDGETTPLGMRFELLTGDAQQSVNLPFHGIHNVHNALAAAAATFAAGCTFEEIVDGLESAESVSGRLQFMTARGGHRLIDDSYNANPTSMRAALKVLVAEPGEHWFVLGDMGELGADASHYHEAIGREAGELGVTRMFAVGELSRAASAAFGSGSKHFEDRDALITALSSALDDQRTNVTLLVKGSRSVGLEKVVDAVRSSGDTPC